MTSGGHGGQQILSSGERGVSIPPGDTNPAVFGITLISLSSVLVPDLAGLYPVP
jgi:hypothetical protein